MRHTGIGNDPQYANYYPIYEYKGNIYRKSSNVGRYSNNFEIGKKVQIYIDPQNPEKIYEDSNVPKLIVYIFGIIGVVMVLSCVFLKVLVFK